MDVEEEEVKKPKKREQRAKAEKERVAGQEQVLAELEQRCNELGLRVIYDDLRSEGGLCRLRNQYLVIINRRASVSTRIRLLAQALRRCEAVQAEPKPMRATMSTSRPASGSGALP
jgi:hypothetical protein